MPDDGILFPLVDGRRSTQRTGRDVVAAAAAAVDPGLAAEIRDERSWRTNYPDHLRALTAAAATSPAAGVAVARAGLQRISTTFVHRTDQGELPPAAAIRTYDGPVPETRTVTGTGTRPARLTVPYRGQDLHGDGLLATLDDWVRRGVVEPPLRDAIAVVDANPDWLDLRGSWFGVLGAGAEMAPTEQLLRWGADVAAVDIPRQDVWQRLEQLGARVAGRLYAPHIATHPWPGADLLRDGPALAAWLGSLGHPLTLGNYAYADGSVFTRISVAADAIIGGLREADGSHGVVCLATPTDVFAVSPEIVTATRRRRTGLVSATLAPATRMLSGGRLLVPNHRTTVRADDGTDVGIADSLVVQQGPNYALAKRVQRWRALASHADGGVAAIHVAPPTSTRSVTKNRVLAAAYEGAAMFDVEVFAPETSRALMTALLVHDLATANGGRRAVVDERELTAAAAHGGLWRVAWETRTAFPFAIARGAGALLRG